MFDNKYKNELLQNINNRKPFLTLYILQRFLDISRQRIHQLIDKNKISGVYKPINNNILKNLTKKNIKNSYIISIEGIKEYLNRRKLSEVLNKFQKYVDTFELETKKFITTDELKLLVDIPPYLFYKYIKELNLPNYLEYKFTLKMFPLDLVQVLINKKESKLYNKFYMYTANSSPLCNYLTLFEATKYINCDRVFITRRINNGTVTNYKLNTQKNNMYLIHFDEVKKLKELYKIRKKHKKSSLNNASDYMTTREFARSVDMPSTRISILCKKGLIEGAIKTDNRWAIPSTELQKFITE